MRRPWSHTACANARPRQGVCPLCAATDSQQGHNLAPLYHTKSPALFARHCPSRMLSAASTCYSARGVAVAPLRRHWSEAHRFFFIKFANLSTILSCASFEAFALLIAFSPALMCPSRRCCASPKAPLQRRKRQAHLDTRPHYCIPTCRPTRRHLACDCMLLKPLTTLHGKSAMSYAAS